MKDMKLLFCLGTFLVGGNFSQADTMNFLFENDMGAPATVSVVVKAGKEWAEKQDSILDDSYAIKRRTQAPVSARDEEEAKELYRYQVQAPDVEEGDYHVAKIYLKKCDNTFLIKAVPITNPAQAYQVTLLKDEEGEPVLEIRKFPLIIPSV